MPHSANIVMLGSALLIVGLGIPLARGKVSRNRWYGFRTPTTLSDDRIWYPANRSMGWFMIVSGSVMGAVAIAALVRVPGVSAMAPFMVLAASGPAALIYGGYVLNRLSSNPDSKQPRD